MAYEKSRLDPFSPCDLAAMILAKDAYEKDFILSFNLLDRDRDGKLEVDLEEICAASSMEMTKIKEVAAELVSRGWFKRKRGFKKPYIYEKTIPLMSFTECAEFIDRKKAYLIDARRLYSNSRPTTFSVSQKDFLTDAPRLSDIRQTVDQTKKDRSVEVDTCYQAYPSKRPDGASTGKSPSLKPKMEKLLTTGYPLLKAIEFHKKTAFKGSVKNLSTFLNQIPDQKEVMDFHEAKAARATGRPSVRVEVEEPIVMPTEQEKIELRAAAQGLPKVLREIALRAIDGEPSPEDHK